MLIDDRTYRVGPQPWRSGPRLALVRLLSLRLLGCLLALAIGALLSISSAEATPSGSSDPGALALLHQAEAMGKPSVGTPAPLARTTPLNLFPATKGATPEPHDGTSVMVALAHALPTLNAADRARARSVLDFTSRLSPSSASMAVAPPGPKGVSTGVSTPVTGEVCDDDYSAKNTYQYYTDATPDGHFLISYTLSGANAISTSYLADVENVLAKVWTTEIEQMGFTAPLVPDGTRTPIRLCNIDPNLYGYCAPVQQSPTDSYAAAACTLRNDYAGFQDPGIDGPDPLAPLKVTAAHEFFHAVQFGKAFNEPLWLMEGTAVWMENEVYPAIHDYLQYLPFSGIRQSRVPFYSEQSLYTPYADFALFKAISGYLGGPVVVKEIWNYLGQNPTTSALAAIQHVSAVHKRSLTSVMLTYAIWNTLPAHSYPDANLYRPAGWWLRTTLDRTKRALPGTRVKVFSLADAAVAITRGSRVVSSTRLQIGVTGPTGSAGGWFTVRRQLVNGTYTVSQYRIGARGTVVTIPFNTSVTYVAITLDNVATSGSPQYFAVRANVL